MSKTLTFTLVLTAVGAVDQAASEKAASAAITSYITERGEQDEAIAEAVHACFDKFPGVSINMPALASMTLQRLNVQPSNYSVMEERVLDYVRENADAVEKKDKKTGAILVQAEPVGTRTFHIAKGKGGGTTRNSDRKVAE